MEKRIGIEMRSLNNLIVRFIDKCSNVDQEDKITGINAFIITYLSVNSEKAIYQKDIEKEFTMTRSTASRVLELMEQKQLIERQSVSHDARLKKLVLTQKAYEFSKAVKSGCDKLENILTSDLSEQELNQFFKCVDKMKENLIRYREEENDA